MNRTGLIVALCIAVVTGAVFALRPDLDVRIAGLFFDADQRQFTLSVHPIAKVTRDAASWVIAAMVAPAVIALVMKLIAPGSRMRIRGRAAVFLITTLALGPGLLVNVILKDHWSRPRPYQISEFGGPSQFVPWWDMRGTCAKNCSFVAGEASGAFWMLAPAALAPQPYRAIATAAALAFGLGVGALRMAFGGHFASDVLFAGVFTFLVIWLVHGLLYRWRSRVSDEQIERTLAQVALRVRHGLRSLSAIFKRVRTTVFKT